MDLKVCITIRFPGKTRGNPATVPDCRSPSGSTTLSHSHLLHDLFVHLVNLTILKYQLFLLLLVTCQEKTHMILEACLLDPMEYTNITENNSLTVLNLHELSNICQFGQFGTSASLQSLQKRRVFTSCGSEQKKNLLESAENLAVSDMSN